MTKEIETRGRATAELLGTRAEQLSHAIKTNTSEAAQAHRATDDRQRRADQRSRRADEPRHQDQYRRGRALDRQSGHLSATVINSRLEQLGQAIKTNTGEAERSLTQLATNTTTAIRSSAHDAERTLSGMSTGVSNVLKQNASEVERTLLAVSAEVARNFVGKADEISIRGQPARRRHDAVSSTRSRAGC